MGRNLCRCPSGFSGGSCENGKIFDENVSIFRPPVRIWAGRFGVLKRYGSLSGNGSTHFIKVQFTSITNDLF